MSYADIFYSAGLPATVIPFLDAPSLEPPAPSGQRGFECRGDLTPTG
jgi:hypothetical protein